MNDLEEFERWMINDARFSPHTVNQTMRKVRYVFQHSDQPLSIFAFQGFIREVWEKKGNKTANGYIKILNRWLRFKGIEEMKYFKEYGSEFTIQYCSAEEVQKLIRVAKAKGAREHAMFSLLFGTGIRLGEAVDLLISNIGSQTITVKGKGQKVREVYLPQETRKAINDYLPHRTAPEGREDIGYLFTTKAARKMSYDFFRKICQDVAFAAGVKFHPHMARHTYATDLLKRGVSILYVSRLLGHEDLDSTSIYLHPSQADAISAAREAIDSQKAQEPHGMDRRGGERPHAGRIEHKDPDSEDESEDDDEPGGELSEKALLLFFGELMQHPVRLDSSRVGINATPSPDAVRSAPNHHFLLPINATPREDKCNTINATPVRKSP
jgi:site-specific recombinase XerD